MGSTQWIVIGVVGIIFMILNGMRKRQEGAASPLIGQPRGTKMSPAMGIGLGIALLVWMVLQVAPSVLGPIMARQKLGPKGQECPKAEIAGWGAAYDPSGDCAIEGKGTTLIIKVPGTLHDLSVEQAQINAPRILRSIEGDFVAEVKVIGEVAPRGERTSNYALPYHGAGLLIWLDRDNYIRLERAAILQETGLLSYINFEQRSSATMQASVAEATPNGPLTLRLERRGPHVSAAYWLEGRGWTELRKQLSVRQCGVSLQVGVAAVNTATDPFTAEFQNIRVDNF